MAFVSISSFTEPPPSKKEAEGKKEGEKGEGIGR